MLVNNKPKKEDIVFTPNKPIIRDEKLLKLYQQHVEGKKLTRINLNEPVISFHPDVTKNLKPAKFAMVFMADLQSDLFVDNVELINRKDKSGNGIAGRPSVEFLYGWLAENTYRFVITLFNRVIHVVEYNTETLEAKDITDEVDLTVIKLFPFGYDSFVSTETSAVYYDIVSGYFIAFQRMASIFGNPDYGNDESGRPRSEYGTNILGMRACLSRRAGDMVTLSKALNFYGGVLTEGDLPIVSTELAVLWRNNIDSIRLSPNNGVIDYIIGGRVSDEIYESGDIAKLEESHVLSLYDYGDLPF